MAWDPWDDGYYDYHSKSKPDLLKDYNPVDKKHMENESLHNKALRDTGFWGSQGAGCIFYSEATGKFLVAKRSKHVEQPNTWGTWGGAIDPGEDPKQGLLREIREETGFKEKPKKVVHLYTFKKGTFKYHNYLVVIPKEFKPKLDWENAGFKWVDYGDWPKPMHFGMEPLLNDKKSARILKQVAQPHIDAKEARKAERHEKIKQLLTKPTNNTVQNFNSVHKFEKFTDPMFPQWFNDYSDKEQEKYITEHPASKMAKMYSKHHLKTDISMASIKLIPIHEEAKDRFPLNSPNNILHRKMEEERFMHDLIDLDELDDRRRQILLERWHSSGLNNILDRNKKMITSEDEMDGDSGEGENGDDEEENVMASFEVKLERIA